MTFLEQKLQLSGNTFLPPNINCNILKCVREVLAEIGSHNLSHHSFQASEGQNVSCLYLQKIEQGGSDWRIFSHSDGDVSSEELL